jgi:predicted DNA-binding WGR domain protein
MTQTFINQTGDSNKFWTITQLDNIYTVTWGKIGAEGRVNTKVFSDNNECIKEIEKLIREKISKGYHQVIDTTQIPNKLIQNYIPMNETVFWEIIESSWSDSPRLNKKRAKALISNEEELLAELSEELSETILENFNKRLLKLSKDDLTAFIHILEERLYNIDREDIHEYTDGSDDGFLYCRCFILGMGKQYYEMVDSDPSKTTMDLEAEIFGFSAYQQYEGKFGEEFDRYSVHSIETCSNENGWTQE